MKYAIQKGNGQWWTGECWGVEQARETYDADSLPIVLVDMGERLELFETGYPIDYVYCDENGENEAGVYEV